jgi:hypothetical protein
VEDVRGLVLVLGCGDGGAGVQAILRMMTQDGFKRQCGKMEGEEQEW